MKVANLLILEVANDGGQDVNEKAWHGAHLLEWAEAAALMKWLVWQSDVIEGPSAPPNTLE